VQFAYQHRATGDAQGARCGLRRPQRQRGALSSPSTGANLAGAGGSQGPVRAGLRRPGPARDLRAGARRSGRGQAPRGWSRPPISTRCCPARGRRGPEVGAPHPRERPTGPGRPAREPSRSGGRRWLSWTVMAVVLAVALVIGSVTRSGSETVSQRVDRIAGDVRCPSCSGLSAAESDAPTAVAVRKLITDRVKAGRNDASIETELVHSYGSGILLRPPASGVAARRVGGARSRRGRWCDRPGRGLPPSSTRRRRRVGGDRRGSGPRRAGRSAKSWPARRHSGTWRRSATSCSVRSRTSTASGRRNDLTEADYRRLRDGYTVRAADVMRRLEALGRARESGDDAEGDAGRDDDGKVVGHQAREPQAPPVEHDSATPATGAVHEAARPPRRRWLGGGGAGADDGEAGRARGRRRRGVVALAVIVCFAAAAAGLVFTRATHRLPGQTASGSVTLADDQRLAQELVQARVLATQGKDLDAIKLYDKVLAVEPRQPEALAYRGWLLRLAGGLRGTTRAFCPRGGRRSAPPRPRTRATPTPGSSSATSSSRTPTTRWAQRRSSEPSWPTIRRPRW